MYILRHENDNDIIVGWNLETGEHGLFTHTAQMAVFMKEEAAWNYMDLLERKGINVSDLTVEKYENLP